MHCTGFLHLFADAGGGGAWRAGQRLLRTLAGAAAVPLLVAGTPGTANAEVVESISWRSYPVPVSPGVSLRSALNAASPVRREGQVFHGFTQWNVRWQFRWLEQRDGRCTITSVRTTLAVEILLPEVGEAGARVWPAWPVFSTALRAHEQGHLELARAAAYLVDRRIADLPAAPSCTLLEIHANQTGREVLEAARRDEQVYDRDTGYGRTQGAWLK